MNPLSAKTEYAGNSLTRAYQKWDDFWFRPADPTPLGLIRICCGLIILYVHFAYTFDLQELMGKDAWLNLEFVQKWRYEAPKPGAPFTWGDFDPTDTDQFGDAPVTEEQKRVDEAYQKQYKVAYAEHYRRLFGGRAPGPFPRSVEEAEYTISYRQFWGNDPRTLAAQGQQIWSVWYHVTDPAAMTAVHLAILASMFLFLVGFCTRLTSVLTWVGMLSYIHRAPTTLFGMDTIMVVAVLYLMVGPCGAALSVDRYLACRRAARQGRSAAFFDPAPLVSANLALRLFQIHVCIIYLASGVSKLQGSSWWMGTAVWGTMANFEFSPVYLAWYRRLLHFISERRWLWELTVTVPTYATLVFELAFPFLVWNRKFRWTMVTAAVLLHTGIAFFMGLVTFSLMMLTIVASFLPAEAIRRTLQRVVHTNGGNGGVGRSKGLSVKAA